MALYTGRNPSLPPPRPIQVPPNKRPPRPSPSPLGDHLARMYDRAPGIASLVNPPRTDPGGQADREKLMEMQRETYRRFLSPPSDDGGGGGVGANPRPPSYPVYPASTTPRQETLNDYTVVAQAHGLPESAYISEHNDFSDRDFIDSISGDRDYIDSLLDQEKHFIFKDDLGPGPPAAGGFGIEGIPLRWAPPSLLEAGEETVAPPAFDPSDLQARLDALENREIPGFDPSDLQGRLGALENREIPGFDPSDLQGRLGALENRVDPSALQRRLGALENRKIPGFDPSDLQGRLGALENREIPTFDPSGLQRRLGALENRKIPGFDPSDLQARLGALENRKIPGFDPTNLQQQIEELRGALGRQSMPAASAARTRRNLGGLVGILPT